MKLRTLGAAALISCLALTGCGTTDAPKSQQSAASGDPVSITDTRGKKITLPAPAKKVVTLEWSVTEYAVALGAEPIGVADPKGYNLWDQTVKLPNKPTDVGVRTEPSIDAIAGLEPDLILADTSSIPKDAMEQMERIAPVAVFASATTDKLFDLVKKNQHDVATLLGKKDAAEKLDRDFSAKLEGAKKTIADAGKTGDPMTVAWPNVQANSTSFRMHGPGSASSAVGQAIGLKDAVTTAGDKEYGLSDSDVEGLRRLPANTHFLYWADSEKGDPLTTLQKNSVWTGLPFVKDGRVAKVADGTWLYGGTASLGALADEIAAAVAKQ